MKLAPTADKIAAKIIPAVLERRLSPTWEALRDNCDIATGSDLPPSLLDRLTDMVERRVRAAR